MPYFLEGLVGAIVWAVANVVYVDLRRKGDRGFGRVVSFFAGMPATWLWLFLVDEGETPRIEAPPDDEDRLFREVAVDRELRERRRPPPVEQGVRDPSEQPPER